MINSSTSDGELNSFFSGLVKKRMEAQKLNQSEVSRLTGVRQDKISRIVNGQSRISLPDFVRIMDVISPDITKDFLVKAGYDSKYYVTLVMEKSDTFVPIANVAHLLRKAINAKETSLYILSPPPSYLQDQEGNHPRRTCSDHRHFPVFRLPDGDGTPHTIVANLNQNLRSIQLEYFMDQALHN